MRASPIPSSTGVDRGNLSTRHTRRADNAIIRTVLRDMSPDDLAHGATLFHEHVSLNNQLFIQMNLENMIDPSRP